MAAKRPLGRRIYITADREGAALRGILAEKPTNDDLRRWLLLGHHYAISRGQDVHVSDSLQVSIVQPKRVSSPGRRQAGNASGSRLTPEEPRASGSSPTVGTISRDFAEAANVASVGIPSPALAGVSSMVSHFMELDE